MLARATILAFLLSVAVANAATMRIAVVAPAEGNLAILGDQIRAGAEKAVAGKADLIPVAENCADGSGPAIADAIVKAHADAAIGFLCFESLEGALKPLSDAGIPALTLSVRAPSLMEDAMKKKWPFFRLAPSQDDERQAITDTIYRLWSNEPFAILDDGTIMSRDTAETVREALEQKGLKPGFTDTFRPTQEVQAALVRRLAKAGVTRVFAAADRQDMAVMAHDAKRLKIPLTFLGGDAVNGLDQDAPMEAGVLAITLPDPATLPSAKTEVAELEKAGGNADGYTLPAYAAVSLLLDAREIAAGSGAAISEALVDTPFDTVIGKIRFGKDHELADNPFRLMEWDGKAFVPTNGNSQ